MRPLRLIARLDIKAPNLIKGIHLEGLRKLGDPEPVARRYYEQGIDELIYMDIVASLYQRNLLADLVRATTENVFIPLTVGGGVRRVEDVDALLRAGADKVAINTAAVARPELISEVSRRFGSQATVLSIEAKRRQDGGWEAYTDNGREHTLLDVVEWAKVGEAAGAGEILLTSVDQEGTQTGFDVPLARQVCDAVSIPVVISGGMGAAEHLTEVVDEAQVDAVAMAHVLHYDVLSLPQIRDAARTTGRAVRTPP